MNEMETREMAAIMQRKEVWKESIHYFINPIFFQIQINLHSLLQVRINPSFFTGTD